MIRNIQYSLELGKNCTIYIPILTVCFYSLRML